MTTASTLISQYLSGERSPVPSVSETLTFVEKFNPEYHAFVEVFNEAALEAAQAEQAYRSGRPCGSLCGVPVGIKDLVQTRERTWFEPSFDNLSLGERLDAAA